MKDVRTFIFFLITVIAAAWIGFRAHGLILEVHTAERQDTGGDGQTHVEQAMTSSTQGDDTRAQEENAGSSDVAEAVLAESACAYTQRSMVHSLLRQYAAAAADLHHAMELDPGRGAVSRSGRHLPALHGRAAAAKQAPVAAPNTRR